MVEMAAAAGIRWSFGSLAGVQDVAAAPGGGHLRRVHSPTTTRYRFAAAGQDSSAGAGTATARCGQTIDAAVHSATVSTAQ